MLERLRGSRLCLLAPAREPGFRRAFFVASGRVSARTLAPGHAGRIEVEAGMAGAMRTEVSFAPEHADELLAVAGFLRRPGPELRIVSLDVGAILAA